MASRMTPEEKELQLRRIQLWTNLRAAQARLMEVTREISSLETHCGHRLTAERETDHHGTRWVYCKICDKNLNHVQGT